MPGRSTARRPGYCRRRKSTSSAIARPTRPAGSGVALVSPTERHPRPARGVAFPVCRCVRRCGTWPWLARGRDRGWQAPLLFSLAGICSPTAVRLAHQNPKAAERAKRLVRAVDVDPGGSDGQTASRQGQCSPAVQPNPEHGTDRRFCWSGPVWSPPPESNRRPHPYHGTTRNRCAHRPFPRSRSTVEAEVIGSLPV